MPCHILIIKINNVCKKKIEMKKIVINNNNTFQRILIAFIKIFQFYFSVLTIINIILK